MVYYLLANKCASPQYNTVRRGDTKVSGVIDVHTWESAPDWIGPDTGLENAVPWLLTRPDPGSYHSACDSDSTMRLVPWWMEAFHDRFTNRHAIGVSIATKADLWDEAPKAWRDAAVKRAAIEAARIADEVYLDGGKHTVVAYLDIPARWLTQAEAHARVPGFVRHGTSDPGRRRDPWPNGASEGDLFLKYYMAARQTGRYAKTTLEENDMPLFTEDHAKAIADTKAKVDWIASVIGFGGKATQFWTIRKDIAELAGHDPIELSDEDVQEIATRVLTGLSPEAIAAAIPKTVAADVAANLKVVVADEEEVA